MASGPKSFYQQAHQFDDLPAMIRAERGLARRLRALPGHKILLTNGPQQYARQVLQHLKLHKHFSHHIAVESMRVHGKLQPKPSRPFLRRLLARHRWSARDCILVEDSVDNLRAAKREGLKDSAAAWLCAASAATAPACPASRCLYRLPLCVGPAFIARSGKNLAPSCGL